MNHTPSRKVAIGRIASGLLGIVCAALLVATLADPARAVGPGERSLWGHWGFSALGTILPPALPQPTPAAAVGTIHFDGRGGCSFTDTINLGGTALSRSSETCSYTVDPSGLGAISVFFAGDPGPTPLSFVIVDRGRELRFIRTDLGVAEGVARRQRF